ncbi:hypothetical protein F1188_04680 [Roseospira marina]|uniref:GIY-YIG nuclease family protein n=1 Tax=Roseospira marina TaxID=140057 RepID=A0A5M6IEC9_9PROT|nr:hypothetical protein [Roseospira marina]KAA5606636.1 hypothetical protein F1188_04680 [Roseospira marina]MBB4313959.1 hypothetical protein [Roseospira marina]MBB5087121.1 hypothetical protein [Roseospira marina]
MSILSYLFGDDDKPIPDPMWQRDSANRFYRLLAMRPGKPNLKGHSGVFVLFHKGVRPGWVYVGATGDLDTAIDRLQSHREISDLERRGGLFMTWAYIRADKRDGVVAYLRSRMAPEVTDPALDTDLGCHPERAKPVPVQLPV